MDENTLYNGDPLMLSQIHFFGYELVENLWNDHCAHHINESVPTIAKLQHGAPWFGVS